MGVSEASLWCKLKRLWLIKKMLITKINIVGGTLNTLKHVVVVIYSPKVILSLVCVLVNRLVYCVNILYLAEGVVSCTYCTRTVVILVSYYCI